MRPAPAGTGSALRAAFSISSRRRSSSRSLACTGSSQQAEGDLLVELRRRQFQQRLESGAGAGGWVRLVGVDMRGQPWVDGFIRAGWTGQPNPAGAALRPPDAAARLVDGGRGGRSTRQPPVYIGQCVPGRSRPRRQPAPSSHRPERLRRGNARPRAAPAARPGSGRTQHNGRSAFMQVASMATDCACPGSSMKRQGRRMTMFWCPPLAMKQVPGSARTRSGRSTRFWTWAKTR